MRSGLAHCSAHYQLPVSEIRAHCQGWIKGNCTYFKVQ